MNLWQHTPGDPRRLIHDGAKPPSSGSLCWQVRTLSAIDKSRAQGQGSGVLRPDLYAVGGR